jgi:pimeloyl-ACP methyl ester carboxylesterase
MSPLVATSCTAEGAIGDRAEVHARELRLGDGRVMSGTNGDGEWPRLPAGRAVELPGRGRTFVRELPGPEGAPVVVLLHGWTATAALNWAPSFASLAGRFRVIAIDHRGHGRGLRADASFRLEDCADDVAALVGELGIERCIAVGYSMGGPIAQLLWQRHPRLVGGLVLCATSATFNGTARERMLLGIAPGGRIIAGAVPMRSITLAALAVCRGWRNLRGAAWWGFEEVARHDWTQIIEAGREICRFDSRSPTRVSRPRSSRRTTTRSFRTDGNSLSPRRSPAPRCASSMAATPPARWHPSRSFPPSSTPARRLHCARRATGSRHPSATPPDSRAARRGPATMRARSNGAEWGNGRRRRPGSWVPASTTNSLT